MKAVGGNPTGPSRRSLLRIGGTTLLATPLALAARTVAAAGSPRKRRIAASWHVMMLPRRRSPESINAWYEKYTGFDGAAYVIMGYAEDLGNRSLTVDDLTPAAGFATSYDGQVIERLDVNGPIQVLHDNVTIRACRITQTTSLNPDGSNQHGISTPSGNPAANVTIEYCSHVSLAEDTGANRAILTYGPGWTVRFNWLNGGHSSGFQQNSPNSGGGYWEYNHVPAVRYYPGSHNTSITFCGVRGDVSTARRNNLRDGNSAAMGIYPQAWCGGTIDNLGVEENVLGVNDDLRTWFYINPGGGGNEPITNTVIRGNVFIPGLNPTGTPREPMGDERGPARWFPDGEGNVWAGNEWLDGTTAEL